MLTLLLCALANPIVLYRPSFFLFHKCVRFKPYAGKCHQSKHTHREKEPVECESGGDKASDKRADACDTIRDEFPVGILPDMPLRIEVFREYRIESRCSDSLA